MTWYLILSVFVALLGAFTLAYQIFKMTVLDARCRGLKHPKFWGLFSLSGGNGSGGLLMYMLGRKSYPVTMTDNEREEMASRKKRAGVSLTFLVVGSIVLFTFLILEF